MKNKRIADLNSVIPAKNDIYVIDTNILLKLFYPINQTPTTYDNNYIEFYAKILKAQSTILLTSIQLSEFINCCIRFQYNLYCSQYQEQTISFKNDYRNTEDFKTNMEIIINIVNTTLFKQMILSNDFFDTLSPDNLLLHKVSYDFNDAFLAEFARIQNATILTDDADFISYNQKVKIVTCNRKLLMFS